MSCDLNSVFVPMQEELFKNQKDFEAKAVKLYEQDHEKCSEYLTNYTMGWGNKVVDEAWKLGDFLWTKYDEKFL